MDIVKLNQKAVNKAVEILKRGGVVIFPTDTVYGFLADAGNKEAAEKIFKIKKRAKSKPLPVFVKDLEMAKELAEISESQEKILKKKWPGKYTFILKSQIPNPKSQINSKLLTKDGTIALRIPKHKFLLQILRKINRPLAQTSVNISGEPPLIKINDIIKKFATSDVAMLIIDGGNLKKARPSKIIDLTYGSVRVIRY